MNFNKKFESFNDWGSCGVGDFYEDPLKILREAVASGKPFNSGWHGWKHELQSMCVSRKDGKTIVECHEYMDDPYGDHELLGDFLEDCEWEKIDNEDTLQVLEDEFFMFDISDSADEEAELPYDATLDDIINTSKDLMKACGDRLETYYKHCICITLTRIYGEGDNAKKIIEERIRKCCGAAEEPKKEQKEA